MINNIKLNEPVQPTVNFCYANYPLMKACLTVGILLILSVLPQLVVLFMKTTVDKFLLIDVFYLIYILLLLITGLNFLCSFLNFYNRTPRRISTFVSKCAKCDMGAVLLLGFCGLIYTFVLWYMNATHVLAPFDHDGTLATEYKRKVGEPMETLPALYAVVQLLFAFYCGLLMEEAREYTATYKVYARLLKIVSQDAEA